MGHTLVTAADGTLYGHKGDIKKQLAAGDPPRWLLTWRDRRGGRTTRITAAQLEEKLEEAAEQARDQRQRLKQANHYEYDGGATGHVELPINTDRLPKAVREKLSVTRDEARRQTGFHQVSPREYRVRIDVGVRGGVKDITIGRDFHH